MADPRQVRRKIHFYLAHPGIDVSTNEIRQFKAVPMLDHISELSGLDKQYERADGNVTFCRIFSTGSNPRLRLSTARMDIHPEGFDRRDSSSWSFDLPEYQGMLEHTHMMFFPNNIVGVEHNQYGPGVGRLEEYVHDKARGIIEPELTFRMLMDREFEENLARLTDWRELRIRVSHRQIEGATAPGIDLDEDDPFRALGALKRFGEAPEYEIAFKSLTSSRGHISRWFRSVGEKYLRRGDTEERSAKLSIVGDDEDGRRQEINVLNNRLVFAEDAVRVGGSGNRSVTPKSAFGAIERAYTGNRERIARAGAIHL